MANGWSSTPIGLAGKVISGVVTNEPASKETAVTAGGSQHGVVRLGISALTRVGTITPKVQSAIGDDWIDIKSGTAITANGHTYIRWNVNNSTDQATLPLLNKLRVVITTTNSGDTLTVDHCEFLQEL